MCQGLPRIRRLGLCPRTGALLVAGCGAAEVDGQPVSLLRLQQQHLQMHQDYLEGRERDEAGVGRAPPRLEIGEGEGSVGGTFDPLDLDRTVAQPPQRIIGGFAASLAVDRDGNVFTCPARGGGLQVFWARGSYRWRTLATDRAASVALPRTPRRHRKHSMLALATVDESYGWETEGAQAGASDGEEGAAKKGRGLAQSWRPGDLGAEGGGSEGKEGGSRDAGSGADSGGGDDGNAAGRAHGEAGENGYSPPGSSMTTPLTTPTNEAAGAGDRTRQQNRQQREKKGAPSTPKDPKAKGARRHSPRLGPDDRYAAVTEALIADSADTSDLNPLFIGGAPKVVKRAKKKKPRRVRDEGEGSKSGSESDSDSESSDEESEVKLTKDQEDLEAANVAVVLRCRPMLPHEVAKGIKSVVRCDTRSHEVHVSGKAHNFKFSRVYDQKTPQRQGE